MASTNPKRGNLPDLNDLLKQIRADSAPPVRSQSQQFRAPQRLSIKDTEVSRLTPKQTPAPAVQQSGAFSSPLQRQKNTNNCCNCCDDMLGMMSIINDSTKKILDALKAEHLLDKKTLINLQKQKEEKERIEKEKQLESSGRKLTTSFKRAIAPLHNVMDSVFKFILFTLASRTIGKVLKWFSDPANEKKVKTLSRFFRDWWPALLGSFVLFGTRFGGAIRATLKMVVATILSIKKMGIPGILSLLKRFGKYGLVVGGVVGLGIAAKNLFFSDKEENTQKTSESETREYNKSPKIPQMFTGGSVPKLNFGGPKDIAINDMSYEEGGPIDTSSGISITGAGPDTQLIAAQPGEIVISKAAVDKFGADTFLRMNMMAGSTNRPKFVNNIQLAAQGGMVGKNSINMTHPNFNFSTSLTNASKYSKTIPNNLSSTTYNITKSDKFDPYYRSQNSRTINNSSNSQSFSGITNKNFFNRKTNVSSSNTKFTSPQAFKYSERPQRIQFKPNSTAMKMSQMTQVSVIPQQSFSRPIYSSPQNIRIRNFNPPENIVREPQKISAPKPRPTQSISIMELPTIDMRKNEKPMNTSATTDVPNFSAIPRISDRYGEDGTLSLYGIRV